MNNLKNNTKRVPRQLARRKPVRSCERISIELYSQVFHLFPIRLDKVLSVTDGETTRTYTYHVVGQLASATVGGGYRTPRDRVGPPGGRPLPQTETFLWDGLALIQRGDEQFINEPHVGNAPKKLRFEGKPRAQRSARKARKGLRGNPVASSKGTSYFNDVLGMTVGAKKDGKYSDTALTAFGEDLTVHSPTPTQNSNFFTGKPFVEGLGHAFLMRNYRAGLAKWQTADPMGYPDGWNQLAYCGNGVVASIDFLGASRIKISETVTKDKVLTPWYEGVDDNGVSCEFRWHAQWYKITWALLDDGKNNAFDTLDWLELGGIGGGILVGAVGLAATTPAVAIAGFVIAIGSGVVYAIRQFEDDDQEYDINVLEKYDEEKFRTYREFRYAPE